VYDVAAAALGATGRWRRQRTRACGRSSSPRTATLKIDRQVERSGSPPVDAPVGLVQRERRAERLVHGRDRAAHDDRPASQIDGHDLEIELLREGFDALDVLRVRAVLRGELAAIDGRARRGHVERGLAAQDDADLEVLR
jgi:hypothetical protein